MTTDRKQINRNASESKLDSCTHPPSIQKSLFAEPIELEATCPTCHGTEFNAIHSTDKWRCSRCGWMVKVLNGTPVDAIDWTTAGRKRKGGQR